MFVYFRILGLISLLLLNLYIIWISFIWGVVFYLLLFCLKSILPNFIYNHTRQQANFFVKTWYSFPILCYYCETYTSGLWYQWWQITDFTSEKPRQMCDYCIQHKILYN